MKARLNLLVLIIGLSLTACQSPTSSESGQRPWPTPKGTGGMTLCPMDAKLCPDGRSSVGRTGSNCEFAACPRS
ncbi:MAG TPA: hypothetical protein PLM98_04150 [Thiolinea sp.]|nr:hypothetical protein [Thiolinea sp.]